MAFFAKAGHRSGFWWSKTQHHSGQVKARCLINKLLCCEPSAPTRLHRPTPGDTDMKPVIALVLLFMLTACTSSPHADTRVYSTPSNDARLDQMLAPIALYPDTVLSHILIASTYPLEIVQAHRWSRDNDHLEGEAAVKAVENEDWEPSVKALVAFPQVLERMSDDLAWTQQLGDAFLDDEARVMDSIQNLRNKAWASGNLDQLPHVQVQREQEVIVIEPAVERVVYVPVYDTRVVYGNWWWPDYPPVYWHHPHYNYSSGFYWGSAIHVGSGFYFSSFHWPRRQVVYVDYHGYHHQRPHFYSGRSISHYHGAKHWRHNPNHRRGVGYRHEHTQRQFNSNRPTTHERYQQRTDRGNFSTAQRAQNAANRPSATADRRQELRNAERIEQRLQQRNRERGINYQRPESYQRPQVSPGEQRREPRQTITPQPSVQQPERIRQNNNQTRHFSSGNQESRQTPARVQREPTVRQPQPATETRAPQRPNIQREATSNSGLRQRAEQPQRIHSQRESRIHRPAAENRGNRQEQR